MVRVDGTPVHAGAWIPAEDDEAVAIGCLGEQSPDLSLDHCSGICGALKSLPLADPQGSMRLINRGNGMASRM